MSAYDHKGDWPAYPVPLNPGESYSGHAPCDGMTLRQYASIKLRVPDSGTEWLDDMIRQSLRDEFSGKAMQALISSRHVDYQRGYYDERVVAKSAYAMADAMLKEREGQA